MSGSRTGAAGCGFVSGGKGIGPGFDVSGSDGSCGVTGGISGFSIESVNRLFVSFGLELETDHWRIIHALKKS